MKLVWSRTARDDLDNIQSYFELRSPRASKRIWTRIIQRVEKLKLMPLAAPFEGDGPARKLVVGKTPYVVLYEVVGSEIRIEAIYHTAQNR